MREETKKKLTLAAILGAMGPGLLAALSGNDAGGIATYSSAGASYGYQMLWMLPVMTILLIVTQETAARCGCVTGKGLASLIRERFGVRKSVLAMAALLIANTESPFLSSRASRVALLYLVFLRVSRCRWSPFLSGCLPCRAVFSASRRFCCW